MHTDGILGSIGATNAFAIIGLIFLILLLLKFLVRIAYGLWLYGTTSVVDFTTYGQWAVVTGATDGIGKAYCRALARRGLSVVIVGRNQEKLERCKAEFENDFPNRQFRTAKVDFSEGQEIYQGLSSATEELEVGVLVNNVGVTYDIPSQMHELQEEFLLKIIRTNAISAVMCTHLYLPQMVRRNTGLVINVASSSAELTLPYMALYASTKAFVQSFSNSLAAEYSGTNIIIQCLLPFVVCTKLAAEYTDISQPSLVMPPTDTYVTSALNLVGRATESYGCVGHSLQGYITNLLPKRLTIYLTLKKMVEHRRRLQANQN